MVALRTVPIGLLTDMRKRAIKRNVYKIIHKTPQGRGNTHIESDLLRQGVHIWDGVLGSMSLCLYVSFLLDALALLASSKPRLKILFLKSHQEVFKDEYLSAKNTPCIHWFSVLLSHKNVPMEQRISHLYFLYFTFDATR